jgi:hypothetical protein
VTKCELVGEVVGMGGGESGLCYIAEQRQLERNHKNPEENLELWVDCLRVTSRQPRQIK